MNHTLYMQKKIGVMILCVLISVGAMAQVVNGHTELARELYTSAKKYLSTRDYANAILVYNQLAKLEPSNLVYRQEMAHTYFLMRDFNRAIEVIAPLVRAKEADVQTFLIAGQIYNGRGFANQAFNAIERGIKKFPNAGILYSDYGTYYLQRKKHEKAERAWEKGVKNDPDFYLNYYHLAKSYFKSKKPLWALLYAEIFVNKERHSVRTEEMKKVLFSSYKQLIANNQLAMLMNKKNRSQRRLSDFEKTVTGIYSDLSPLVMGGVEIDNLIMLRTRFLLEWMQFHDEQYPFALFQFQNNLLVNGHFEAYNQWLFGKAENKEEFINWVKENKVPYAAFENIFPKMRLQTERNQYYK